MTRDDQHWWPVWIPLCGYRCGYCGCRCGYICGDLATTRRRAATTSHNDERRRGDDRRPADGDGDRIEAGTDDTTARRPALVVRAGGVRIEVGDDATTKTRRRRR